MKHLVLSCTRVLALVSPLCAYGIQESQLTPSSSLKLSPPPNQRLGAWITQNHAGLAKSAFWPATMWLDAEASSRQSKEKQLIVDELTTLAARQPDSSVELNALVQQLLAMPVTGRQTLVLQDPWLMQLHAPLEPLTREGQQFVFTGRPDRVRVIHPLSQNCDADFEPSRWANDYLRACTTTSSSDFVWLIQPDGQVMRMGVGNWNGHEQQSPAPGALLWVPPASIPLQLSERIAKMMATQGVAQGASKPQPLPTVASQTPRQLPVFVNDWGMIGLMQTPSARTPGAGQFSLSTSKVWPYSHYSISMSPFDELELGFRYTDIDNKLYGPSIAGNQSYKDKSSEVKWRVFEETSLRPAVAIGLRDPGGTGLFAGEYLVASKRWQDFDFNLGLGWGYLGARGNIANPLSVLGERFKSRQGSRISTAGNANLSSLFTGPTALMGGVQWHSPVPDLVFKLELDGNNYQSEPFNNDLKQPKSPFNWGLAWKTGPLSISFGQERGRQWMLGFSLSTDLSKAYQSKRSEPAAWPVKKPVVDAQRVIPQQPLDTSPTPPDISAPNQAVATAMAEQTGWIVHNIRQQGETLIVELDNTQGFSLAQRIDRGMSVVHELAPASVRTVRFVLMQQGITVSTRTMDRYEWATPRHAWQGQHPTHSSVPVITDPVTHSAPTGRKQSINTALGYQQHLGGPDGYLYALNANATGYLPMWKGAWLQGTVNARLLDNYDQYKYTAPSQLPRVRTRIRDYLTTERVTLPNMQVNQLNQWGDGLYSLVYAGALESMFSGVGTELMWRPLGSNWALGADFNTLAQRDFDQRLGLRDYRVKSGHLTAYWNTQWQGVEAKLMVGQYLAGDRGATFEVARRFNNGAKMGAWLTKTNVAASTFGEGSFDKGIFVSIPFDAFMTAWSNNSFNLTWQPLIRDGGAILNRSQTLWNLTRSRDQREWLGEKP